MFEGLLQPLRPKYNQGQECQEQHSREAQRVSFVLSLFWSSLRTRSDVVSLCFRADLKFLIPSPSPFPKSANFLGPKHNKAIPTMSNRC